MMDVCKRRRIAGITLMELMIVVVVVGILAAIAYPTYQEQVRKSRRSDAKNALADLASRQHQYFSDNKTYADTLAKLKWFASGKSPEGFYNLAVTIPAGDQVTVGGVTTNVGFVLTATATGAQTQDAKCVTFSINSAGKKTHTGTATKCW